VRCTRERACSVDARCGLLVGARSRRIDSTRLGYAPYGSMWPPTATTRDKGGRCGRRDSEHTRTRISGVHGNGGSFSERFPLPNALVLMRSNWLLLADRGICAGYSDIHSMSIHDVDRPSPPSESMVRLERWAPRSQWMSDPGPGGGSDDLIQRVSSSGGRCIRCNIHGITAISNHPSAS
jgi:hypothetical protein